MISDNRLLEVYMIGFKDCPDNNDMSSNYLHESLERKAYNLGWDHYIIGDDVSSIDFMSNNEILRLIKSV